jgi:hypothetical protein
VGRHYGLGREASVRRGGIAGLLGLLFLASLSACDADAGAGGPGAATEGRACQVIEFDVVESAIGVRFDTAGGAKSDETYTCVLGQTGRAFPDLTLAMSVTAADDLIFRATLTPSNSSVVPDLGRSAYQVGLAAVTASDGTASGPGVEVGWLSASSRLLVLRYTHAAGVVETDIAALPPKLVALARQIEQAIVAAPTLG